MQAFKHSVALTLGMPKVLVQDFSLQALGIVHLDASVAPLDDLAVVVRQHLGELVEKLRHRVVLLAATAGAIAIGVVCYEP